MAFIRPYMDTDFDACGRICIETLPPMLTTSSAAATLAPYLWTHPYTLLSPSTCHVLDDGTGRAVGYCIGCPDVYAFVAEYDRYITTILSRVIAEPDLSIRQPWITSFMTTNHEGQDVRNEVANPLAVAQNAYRADWIMLEGKEAVTSRWRATMHIDILPPWQGQGWGRQLINRFVASVQSSGQDYGEGEHIGVGGENSKVVPFYQKVGFRVIRAGDRDGNIWMVRDIAKV